MMARNDKKRPVKPRTKQPKAQEPKKHRFFDESKCDRCLACLELCAYLDLERDEAAREKEELIQGGPAKRVLAECVSCHACDVFCEKGCSPYGLIIERWFERYQKEGLPERARYFMPHSAANFRGFVMDKLPAKEKALVKKWGAKKARLTGTVLYPGCNFTAQAFLSQSRLFDGMTLHGGLDLCCGEMYYRMGLFDQVEKTAAALVAYYAEHEIETMVFVCPACYNMFTNILPEKFGVKFKFKTRFITDVLLEKIAQGTLRLDKPVNRTVAVHDSCHARILGPEFSKKQRELLRAAGVTPMEPNPGGADGICCGIAAGCSRYDPRDVLRVSKMAIDAARRSGAKEIAAYCGGCLLVLSGIGSVMPGGLPVLHSLQYVAMAMGEKPELKQTSRAMLISLGVARHSIPAALSKKRFKLT